MPASLDHRDRILPAALAALLFVAAVARAAEPGGPQAVHCPLCAPRAELLQCLEHRYGERVRITAASRIGWPLEIAVGGDGGWTVILTRPDGLACVGGYGTDWREDRGL